LNSEGYNEVLGLYLGYGTLSNKQHTSNYPSVYLFNQQEELIVEEWISAEFRQQLGELKFTYTDKSQRLWHPLQNVRRGPKKSALARAGLKYQYDIICAAPRLIQQLARGQGEDAAMPYLDVYLTDRSAIRSKLAQEADVDPETVKRLVNALLCGAHISKKSTTSIYALLDGDVARIEFFRQHPFISGLRKDFKCCWDMIKFFVPRTLVRKASLGCRSSIARCLSALFRITCNPIACRMRRFIICLRAMC
jgi:hypothetical protein